MLRQRRCCPRWWAALSESAGRTQAWVDETVQQCEAAVQDSAALQGGRQFKAVRQGVLAQVAHVVDEMSPGSALRDQRCHTPSAPPPLGERLRTGAGAEAAHAHAGASAAPREAYDDAEFYHSLLRDLLDDGGAPTTSSAGLKLKHKKRKTESRQSKGRQLSFEVQPKLQHFMFPVVPERPVVLTELFKSVFGKRLDVHAGGDDAAGGDEAVANDAAAPSIFG